ncbi:MAG: hypothetical protein ACOCWR_11550 [Oceanidesulfovibrio sp.]
MPRSAIRFTLLFCIASLVLCTGAFPEPAESADNSAQLFSPFTPMEDPNRAVHALGVLFRANLADLLPGEKAQGMVRYPGPLQRLGLRVHAGQKVRILGTDAGLRLEIQGLGALEGRRKEGGFAWGTAEQ